MRRREFIVLHGGPGVGASLFKLSFTIEGRSF